LLMAEMCIPYFCGFKMRLFSHFSELKIRVRLIFGALFFTLWKSWKHNFPQRTSDL